MHKYLVEIVQSYHIRLTVLQDFRESPFIAIACMYLTAFMLFTTYKLVKVGYGVSNSIVHNQSDFYYLPCLQGASTHIDRFEDLEGQLKTKFRL